MDALEKKAREIMSEHIRRNGATYGSMALEIAITAALRAEREECLKLLEGDVLEKPDDLCQKCKIVTFRILDKIAAAIRGREKPLP